MANDDKRLKRHATNPGGSTRVSLHPLSLEDALRGVIATGPMDDGAKKPDRKPDEPTSPHHAEHEDPVERAKTAMRKAREKAPGRNRRLKGEPTPGG